MLFHMLRPRFIDQFENDARTQVKFHIFMAWVWFACMVLIPFVPVLWGWTLPALIIQEVSLYANWSTEIGALTAAQASLKADRGQHPPLAVDL